VLFELNCHCYRRSGRLTHRIAVKYVAIERAHFQWSRKIFYVPLHFFGSIVYTSTISRFGERFRDGQYSLVSFLFAVLFMVPRAQPFVEVGARAPVPYGVGATDHPLYHI